MPNKLFIETGPKPAVMVGTGDPPSGFVDITTIEGVGNCQELKQIMDFNAIRDWISELLLAKDPNIGTAFGLCSMAEKSIVCKFILMPYSVRLLFFTDEQDRENWNELVIRTEGTPIAAISGRSLVYQKMRIHVSNYVRREVWHSGDYFANLTMAQQFFRDVFFMKELFIGSNDPEFKEFLTSSGRYDVTTGFRSKSYWIADLETELMEIYNEY